MNSRLPSGETRTTNGLSPPGVGIVATCCADATSITPTFWLPWFVTYAVLPSGEKSRRGDAPGRNEAVHCARLSARDADAAIEQLGEVRQAVLAHRHAERRRSRHVVDQQPARVRVRPAAWGRGGHRHARRGRGKRRLRSGGSLIGRARG